ncbi:hypothetical protein ACJMK2_017716 [Sinanodonta woodiana]|uniref:VWFD domain-containing protein n=1 Tax=Sinanodonta woodiana TaxID=1069815 RepID=A0ABD3UBI3_SINWO
MLRGRSCAKEHLLKMPISVITFLSVVLHISYGQDCRVNYELLPQLARRARNYAVAENEPMLFDEDLDSSKWYSVGPNNMPTNYSSLNIGNCGTYYPIWMDGSIPKEGDGVVNRTACIVSFSSSCALKKTIQVRNCTTHMIYKLEPTTHTSAYCFDVLPEMPDIKPAPSFKSALAEVKHELVFIDETSVFGHLQIKKPNLIFSCAFNKSNDETMLYTITWYVNEAVLETIGPVIYNNIRSTDMKEGELIKKGFKLGTTIKCGVRASISRDGNLGNITTSLGFWIGIKILTPTVVIKQGGTGVVRLQSTVPFGCVQSIRDPGCLLDIQMYDDHDSYDCTKSSVSVRNSEQCGTQIHGSTFQESKAGIFFHEEANITITTKDTQDFIQDQNMFRLRLKTPIGSPVNDIMQDNYLGDIRASILHSLLKVQVKEEKAWIYKNCYARVDPHMTTFDQKAYENQNLGEFVLYQHTEYKQEVQMKTFPCYSAKCACAVSIRAGGELFIINVCTVPSLINHAHCGEKLMNIRRIHAYKYEIHMPLGTMVVVDINQWPLPLLSLNIEIAPSVKDVGKTVGLCGTLNNNQADDFTTPSNTIKQDNNEFSNSWKIDRSKSFLEPANQNPENWDETLFLCVCPAAIKSGTTLSTVSGNKRDPLCSPSVYQACTKKTAFPVFHGEEYNDNHCDIISKRSLVSQEKEIQRILSSNRIMDAKTLRMHSLTKRSIQNYTAEEAKSTCESIFNRSCLASSIESLANSTVNKNSALHDCIFDLVTTGDLKLVDVHCSSYIAQTERNIRRDSVLRMNHSQEIASFYARTCINNCSGHGDCINGTCTCHDRYIEQDCSIYIEDPPVVLDTYGGGLCSRNNDTCCGRLPIYGYRLVSGTTKQKLETLRVMDNGTTEIVETTVNDLQILNAFQAYMDVPCHTNTKRSTNAGIGAVILVHGVRVSLTNDGSMYSSPHYFYTYDSLCQEYQQNIYGYTFHMKSGRCFINGICYSEGEKAPSDSCKQCRPGIDPFSFSGGIFLRCFINVLYLNLIVSFQIKCSVRASGSKDGSLGNITTSLGFWIGIKILTPSVVMKQGGTGVVRLQSTVPFGCVKYQNDPDCLLDIQMYDDHDSYDCTKNSVSIRNSEQCGTRIRGSTFQQSKKGILFYEEGNITITTKDTQDSNQDRNLFHLRLKTPTGSPVNEIMQDNYLGDITAIQAEQTGKHKNCYAHVDPHMMTFDQKTYENQNLGEFVLYQHTEYKQEVQMKTFPCAGLTCACAVSIRAGGELFIINVCTEPSLINHAHCGEQLMNIRRIYAYKYEIHMPLGTIVVVVINQFNTPLRSLDIDITPSVKDVGKTLGLCGTMNNNQTDDFATPSKTVKQDNNEFSNSWNRSWNLQIKNQTNWDKELFLCVCPAAIKSSTTISTVSGNKRDPLCSPSVYQACTKHTVFPVFRGEEYNDNHCNIISKRSLVSQEREVQRILRSNRIMDRNTLRMHSLTKRSIQNYTAEEAKSICESTFNRSCLTSSIENLVNSTVNKDSAIHDCIFDLVAMGDLKVVGVHCSSYIAQTERNIRRDSVLRMNHPQEIASFYARTCINNCSGNGDCINGICTCHDHYIEQDCSISTEDPPVVLDTYGGGLCSRNDDDCCGRLPIYGYRFVSGTTKQKLETLRVTDNGTMVIVKTTVNDLQILNAFQAFMDVPCHTNTKRSSGSSTGPVILVHGVRVSLTNDGVMYGSSQYFYTYDSLCQEYQRNIHGYTFHMKSGRCYINDICYSEGEKAPTDSCKQCRPGIDPFSFTGGYAEYPTLKAELGPRRKIKLGKETSVTRNGNTGRPSQLLSNELYNGFRVKKINDQIWTSTFI